MIGVDDKALSPNEAKKLANENWSVMLNWKEIMKLRVPRLEDPRKTAPAGAQDQSGRP